MSDQNGITTAEPTAEPTAETSNEATLKKTVRAFAKYPTAANYNAVLKAMLAVQAAYVAQFHIGEK
jgi:hypothetical protein